MNEFDTALETFLTEWVDRVPRAELVEKLRDAADVLAEDDEGVDEDA